MSDYRIAPAKRWEEGGTDGHVCTRDLYSTSTTTLEDGTKPPPPLPPFPENNSWLRHCYMILIVNADDIIAMFDVLDMALWNA